MKNSVSVGVVQQGFTLIELMIVIAIIGILAAIALPAYQDYITRAQVTEAVQLMAGLKGAVSENYGSDGICPDNTGRGKFGIEIPPQIKGSYVQEIRAMATPSKTASCDLTAKFKASNVSEHLRSKTITLTMQVVSGSELWSCHSTDIKPQHLPGACRPQ